MIRATKGKSRSTNHWKGNWMVRLGPKRLALRWGHLGCIALFNDFFLGGFFGANFCNLVPFWRILGSPNGGKNWILKGVLRCFFRIRLGIGFLTVFSCFFRVQTLIFVRTASVLEHFHKIDGFLKSSKKAWILAPFSEAKMEKNHRKIVLRNMRFFDTDFSAFFCDF